MTDKKEEERAKYDRRMNAIIIGVVITMMIAMAGLPLAMNAISNLR